MGAINRLRGLIRAGGLFLFLCLSGLSVAQPLEPELVEAPAGAFLYGSSASEREEYLSPPGEPRQREVTLNAFWIGKYEVTNREYAAFIRDGGYTTSAYWLPEGWSFLQRFGWKEPRRWRDKDYNGPDKSTYPVCGVSWFEAQAYCRWLAEKTGKPYRLPRETEWEKAARGTDGRVFPWGMFWNPYLCNWLGDTKGDRQPHPDLDPYIYTAPVGFYPGGKSPYGCYDMAGNVLEWCADLFFEEDNPQRAASDYRVLRGGCFLSGYPRLLRCAWRGGTSPEIGHVYWGIIGFRVAMDATEEKTVFSTPTHPQ